MEPLIKIFFAIPCGSFYANQRIIIEKICSLYNIQPIINETDYKTDSLLGQIFDQINKADYFIADISSNSPNVIFELGYAFRAKHISRIGVLLANVTQCPSDLNDIKRMQYGRYKEFAEKINNWISQFFHTDIPIDDSFFPLIEYYETFKDKDKFLKEWDTPLGCDYSLTDKGFRFTNAHLPVISKHLAYLENYVFEFNGIINQSIIGWIVNGTKHNYEDPVIDFCIMFNLNVDGYIHPHIFSKNKLNLSSHYQPFDRLKISEEIDLNKLLNIKTYVNGSNIEVLINEILCFKDDFARKPYNEYYNSVPYKTNQIGFRCHPNEVATIYSVKVESLN